MREIGPQEAAQMLQDDPDTTVLLDVREDYELADAAVACAVHMPMNSVPTNLDILERDKTIICMCHLGGRSAQVAHYLLSQGYTKVINLAGGIEAWRAEVDPELSGRS